MTRRTTTRPEVRVGGFWLSTITPRGWGGLRHQTRTNGSWEASWSIPIVRGWRHPALVYGARVEIWFGPILLWSGALDEPDWDAGSFVAIGACRDGEDAIALDGSGNSSTAPNTVVDAAIARGVLSWTRVGNFGTTPVGDNDGSLVTVNSVLDAWAQANGSRWFVTPDRRLIIEPLPTTPTIHVVHGSGALGSAADERADRVFVRYTDSTTGRLATVSYPASTPTSGIERPLDATDRGPMSSTAALTLATNTWASLAGGSGWTNGLTLGRGQVVRPGGPEEDLAFVKAGDMIRVPDQPDPNGLAQYLDVIIGDTDYDWTEDQIQVNPVGLAARTQDAVLEQVGTLAAAAYEKASTPTAGDTGWISLTSVLGGVTAQYKASAGWVTVRLGGTVTSMASGSATVVSAGGLPADTRPAADIWSGAFVSGGGWIGVSGAGGVEIRHEAGTARTGSVRASFTYPIG